MFIVIQNQFFEGAVVPVACRNSRGEYIIFDTERAAFEYGGTMNLTFFVTEIETTEQIEDVLDRELFYG